MLVFEKHRASVEGKYRDSRLVARLKSPKTEHRSENPFQHTDYRGLVYADSNEALELLVENRSTPYRIRNLIQQGLDTTRTSRQALGRASSTFMTTPKPSATKSVFPLPLNFAATTSSSFGKADMVKTTFYRWPSISGSSSVRVSQKVSGCSSPQDDKRKGLQDYRVMMQAHQIRFGNKTKKVGFSRMMLQEALNYETVAREKFQFKRTGLKEAKIKKQLSKLL